ncbi:MAG: DUF4906 domain-containing protein [Mediterranea sp.]|jgi:hypothetical protein|nr:DUF4906 domain-containing protein [Mediterranea sp.]
MNWKKFLSVGITVISSLSACVEEKAFPIDNVDEGYSVLRFSLSDGTPPLTRATDDNVVYDLNILVYDSNGQLLKSDYQQGLNQGASGSKSFSLAVKPGSGYTLYGIANVGTNLPTISDVSNQAKLIDLATSLPSWNALDTGSNLLMSGSLTGINATGGAHTTLPNLTLRRLASHLTIQVQPDPNNSSPLTLSGYCFYGLPKKTYYIENQADATDRDNPSDWLNSGLQKISNGSPSFTTQLYMYENRAGDVPSITKESQKHMFDAPDSAACIVIYGKSAHTPKGLTWRIYLGQNNTSSFNIRRNQRGTVTINLKDTYNDSRVDYVLDYGLLAGSNVYWKEGDCPHTKGVVENGYLTFDEVDMGNSDYQGLFFNYGSLVGVSPRYIDRTNINQLNQLKVFYPQDDQGTFLTSTIASKFANASSIPTGFSGAMSPANYIGDICAYLSQKGIVRQNWRLPTKAELVRTDKFTNKLNWGDAANPWVKTGNWNINLNSMTADDTGKLKIRDSGGPAGASLKDIGSSFFPVSGYLTTSGSASSGNTGYWTATSSGINMRFYIQLSQNGFSSFANGGNPVLFYPVRCIRIQ